MTDYLLCGWCVRSAIELPELPPWNGEARSPDVEIAVVSTIRDLPDAVLVPLVSEGADTAPLQVRVAPGGHTVVTAVNVAHFLVCDGRRVDVAPCTPLDAAAVRVFLLGTVLAVLCYQRGLLPLHAACLMPPGRSVDPHTPRGAVAIGGDSGAGKSTLAATLTRQGVPMLSDDVCVVDATDGDAPVVLPSVARLKLWRDALERLGIPLDAGERIRHGLDKFALYDLPAFHAEAAPLTAIYHLTRSDDAPNPAPVPLSGLAALQALYRCVYRVPIGVAISGEQAIGRVVMALIAAVPVFRIGHAPAADGPQRLSAMLLEHCLDRQCITSWPRRNVIGSGGPSLSWER